MKDYNHSNAPLAPILDSNKEFLEEQKTEILASWIDDELRYHISHNL